MFFSSLATFFDSLLVISQRVIRFFDLIFIRRTVNAAAIITAIVCILLLVLLDYANKYLRKYVKKIPIHIPAQLIVVSATPPRCDNAESA